MTNDHVEPLLGNDYEQLCGVRRELLFAASRLCGINFDMQLTQYIGSAGDATKLVHESELTVSKVAAGLHNIGNIILRGGRGLITGHFDELIDAATATVVEHGEAWPVSLVGRLALADGAAELVLPARDIVQYVGNIEYARRVVQGRI